MPEVVTIPNTVFGLLALIITTLCGVIIWQQNRIDKKVAMYDEIQEQRLADFREVVSKNTEVIRDNANSNKILAEKIDSSRGRS